MKYKNVNTSNIITEEEYNALLLREGEELWNSLDDEEKAEYSSKDAYIAKTMEGIDTDFIAVEE